MSATPEKRTAMEQHTRNYNLLKVPLVLGGLGFGLYAGMRPGSWVWFSWHPLLMAIAAFSCAGNATLLKKIGGYNNTKMHGNLFFGANLLILAGGYVIYSNKEMQGKEHYTTYHSWAGLVSIGMLLLLQVVGGAGLHPDFGFLKTSKPVRYIHKMSGKFALLTMWVCCFLGIYQMSAGEDILHGAVALSIALVAFFVVL